MFIILLIYVCVCAVLSYTKFSIRESLTLSYKNLFISAELDSTNFGFDTGLMYINSAGDEETTIHNQHRFTLSLAILHLKVFLVEKY